MKILKITLILYLILSAISKADFIEFIEIENNNRISKETIITYGEIKLKKNYTDDDINQILKNLYDTNFFEDIEIVIKDNILNKSY